MIGRLLEMRHDSRPPAALYVCYWSLRDPLCQTQSLGYLRGLARRGYRFVLMTYEQERYRLSDTERREAARALATEGIEWHPLRYHKRWLPVSKAVDAATGVVSGLTVLARTGAPVIHSRGTNAAGIALLLALITGRKFLYDADAPLSEEYAETGHWKRGSRLARLTGWLERRALRRADAIVVLTARRRDELRTLTSGGVDVEVVPCCVDLRRFRPDAPARAARRARFGFDGRRVFVYAGKIGKRYLVEQMFHFYRVARAADDRLHLVILSGDPAVHFDELAGRAGVAHDAYEVHHADAADVPDWLAAADAGLAFIRSEPVERASSPIKIGEYLAAGLPVVTTPGIGDFSDSIERDRLGVVVQSLDDAGYRESAAALAALWNEGDCVPARCRNWALEHLSLDGAGVARFHRVYQQLLQNHD